MISRAAPDTPGLQTTASALASTQAANARGAADLSGRSSHRNPKPRTAARPAQSGRELISAETAEINTELRDPPLGWRGFSSSFSSSSITCLGPTYALDAALSATAR